MATIVAILIISVGILLAGWGLWEGFPLIRSRLAPPLYDREADLERMLREAVRCRDRSIVKASTFSHLELYRDWDRQVQGLQRELDKLRENRSQI